MKWFTCACLVLLLGLPLMAQNRILMVSSQIDNPGDTAILSEIVAELNYTPEYTRTIPPDLDTYRYSLVILGDYQEYDCSHLKQYVSSGGGLILTGSVPYVMLRECADERDAIDIVGFNSYTNGSGELRAAVDLDQIDLPADSLLDRTPCEIGFGALSEGREGSEILAKWYCPGQQNKIAAITRNRRGSGKVFYFSRLLSTIRVRKLLSWAIEDGVEYRWGDADNSGRINLTDAVYIMRIVFNGGPMPPIANAGDCNGDGLINISDAVWLINYIFVSGPAPVAGKVF
jgi:hypothetical protein